MFKKCKPEYEKLSSIPHPDYEVRDTRVSDYLRKYGQGKLEVMPQDNRPEVHDDRTEEEMLNSPQSAVDTFGADALDVMQEIENNRERFEAMETAIEMTKTERQKFDNAVKVINDPNSSESQKLAAIRVLDDLEAKGKVTRARD